MRGQRKSGRAETGERRRVTMLALIEREQFALLRPGRDEGLALDRTGRVAQPVQRRGALERIGGVRKVFVKSAGQVCGEGHCSFADGKVIEMISEGGGESQCFHRSGFRLFGQGFVDLFDGVVYGIDGSVA